MSPGPLHYRGPDGRCLECGETFPCSTGIAIYEAVKRAIEHPTRPRAPAPATTILLLDNDLLLVDLLTFAFRRAGLESISASDGPAALRLFGEQQPSLVLLNIRQFADGSSGLEVVKKLRQQSHVPIIVMTGIDSVDDKVLALEAGADDYVTRPFSHRELIARIGAQLRRSGWGRERSESCFGKVTA